MVGCHAPPTASLTIYQIGTIKDTTDEIYRQLISEYRQRWVQLDQIIAYSPTTYRQGTKTTVPVIANWVADAVYHTAGNVMGRAPHLVMMPVGKGFQQIPRGNISYRDMYRLFPGHFRWEFRQLPLHIVEQLFESTISQKSWGISAGTIIEKKRGQKIKIDCRDLKDGPSSKIDIILVRDGWIDNQLFPFLIDYPALLQGNNLVEFIISYCHSFTAAGIPLRISTEKRIYIYD